jgi:hypothetical protein
MAKRNKGMCDNYDNKIPPVEKNKTYWTIAALSK